MTEKINPEELKDSLTDITNQFKELMNNIYDRFKKVFGIEIGETTNETKDELKNLEDELFKKDENEFKNEIQKELEDIEGNMKKSDTIIGKLVKKISEVKDWFKWILEKNNGEYLIQEDLRKKEVESFLLLLKEKSNNDSDSSKPDLVADDIDYIKNYTIEKSKICKNVLENDKIKKLPDEYKTRQKVLETYNKILEEKGDYKLVTEDLIIEKIEQESK